MSEFTYTDAITVQAAIEIAGLTVPPSLVRGIELAEQMDTLRNAETNRDVLSLTDDEVGAFFERRVLRETGYARTPSAYAWVGAHEHIVHDLFAQVRTALLVEADQVIDEMREPFEALGARLTAHVTDHGFTSTSDGNEVLAILDHAATDEQLLAKARALHEARELLPQLGPYASVRRTLAEKLELSPTQAERGKLGQYGDGNDWSVLFAAGDLWSMDGHLNLNQNPHGSLDWLALARGGLAMNSIDTVRAKVSKRQSLEYARSETGDVTPDATHPAAR